MTKTIALIAAIILLLIITSPSYAITIFEKLLYKKAVIKAYAAKVLVNPLTGEIKYLWTRDTTSSTTGYWAPVSGTSKEQFQIMYDQENEQKVNKSSDMDK